MTGAKGSCAGNWRREQKLMKRKQPQKQNQNDHEIRALIAHWARSVEDDAPDFRAAWASAHARVMARRRRLLPPPLQWAALLMLLLAGGVFGLLHSGSQPKARIGPKMPAAPAVQWPTWHSPTEVLLGQSTDSAERLAESYFWELSAGFPDAPSQFATWIGPTDFLLREARRPDGRQKVTEDFESQPQS